MRWRVPSRQDRAGTQERPSPLTRVLMFSCLGALALLGWSLWNWRVPGNDIGYQPQQPIAFSHKLHAGDMQLQCLYCHFAAERGRYAGVPAARSCMNCHQQVTTSYQMLQQERARAAAEGRQARRIVSAEMRKLFNALALDDQLRPDPRLQPIPIRWVRVHQLPDFSYFDHRSHQRAAIDCSICHGESQTFDQMRQVQPLSMGWCVNCHRTSNAQAATTGQDINAPLDCFTCHR